MQFKVLIFFVFSLFQCGTSLTEFEETAKIRISNFKFEVSENPNLQKDYEAEIDGGVVTFDFKNDIIDIRYLVPTVDYTGLHITLDVEKRDDFEFETLFEITSMYDFKQYVIITKNYRLPFIKYNPKDEWEKQINGQVLTGQDEFADMEIDLNNNIYATGISNTGWGKRPWIQKYNSSGILLKEIIYKNGEVDDHYFMHSAALDEANELIYLCGYKQHPDPIQITNGIIIQFDMDLNFIKYFGLNDYLAGECVDIIVDRSDNNIIVAEKGRNVSAADSGIDFIVRKHNRTSSAIMYTYIFEGMI